MMIEIGRSKFHLIASQKLKSLTIVSSLVVSSLASETENPEVDLI